MSRGKIPTERRTISPALFYDIETSAAHSWTEFLCGVTKDMATGQVKRWTWRTEEEMADEILATEGEVWGHNAGRFDHRWLLRRVIARGLKASITAAGSRLVVIRVGKCKLLDSKALFPISLDELTADGKKKKSTCPIPFDRFSRGLSPAELELVLDYCEMDVESLAEAVGDMSAHAERLDLDLGATIGSSSYRCAARWLQLPPADFSMGEHLRLRHGYYGGRTEIYCLWADFAWEHDVNSAYSDALNRTPLPVGPRRWIDSAAEARACYRAGKPGMYGAHVTVPHGLHIPPLPARTRHGLLYPTGEWSGWYVLPELRHAEALGADVDPVVACVWDETAPVFSPFVTRLYDARHAAGKKSALGKNLKWYMNSVTGKLGQRPVRSEIHLWPEDGPQEGWIELSSDPQIFTHTRPGLDACAHVVWAAYLTAATRIKLNLKQLEDGDGGRDMLMSDTDSCISEGERTGVGEALGQWERGGPYRTAVDPATGETVRAFEALAPKVYRLSDGKMRAKGIELPKGLEAQAATFARLKRGDTVSWTTPGAWRSSLKASGGRDPFRQAAMARSLKPLKGWIGGRLLDADGIHTHAPRVGAGERVTL